MMISSKYDEEEIEICEYIVSRINRFIFDKSIELIIPKSYDFEGK